MEAGLAMLLVHSSKYFLYEYAHVLVFYCAQIARVLNLSTLNLSAAQGLTAPSYLAMPLVRSSRYVLYEYAHVLFLPRPGCAHLACMPNLSTPNLSTAQDGSGPRRSIPPRHAACT